MVDSVQPISLLDSVLNAQSTRVEMSVVMLKKVQELTRQQGEALVQMIEKSAPQAVGQKLDTYA